MNVHIGAKWRIRWNNLYGGGDAAYASNASMLRRLSDRPILFPDVSDFPSFPRLLLQKKLWGYIYVYFTTKVVQSQLQIKKYKSDRTRARGMYKNIKSYLTNTFKPT